MNEIKPNFNVGISWGEWRDYQQRLSNREWRKLKVLAFATIAICAILLIQFKILTPVH